MVARAVGEAGAPGSVTGSLESIAIDVDKSRCGICAGATRVACGSVAELLLRTLARTSKLRSCRRRCGDVACGCGTGFELYDCCW